MMLVAGLEFGSWRYREGAYEAIYIMPIVVDLRSCSGELDGSYMQR